MCNTMHDHHTAHHTAPLQGTAWQPRRPPPATAIGLPPLQPSPSAQITGHQGGQRAAGH